MDKRFENLDTFINTCEQENVFSLHATTYGFEKKPTRTLLHNHQYEYSVHFILSGAGYLRYEGYSEIRLKAGDLFFLLPYDKRISYRPDPNKPWTYCWINFMGGITEILAHINVSHKSPFVRVKNRSEIINLFWNMFNTINSHFRFSGFLVSNTVGSILFALLKNSDNAKKQKKSSSYVEQAQKYIEEHYADPCLNIKKVAAHCNLNSAYFSRYFKVATGINFSLFLMDFRIQKATSLIRSGVYNIQQLSDSVGFLSPYYFSDCFLRILKIRPKTYITQVKEAEKTTTPKNSVNHIV